MVIIDDSSVSNEIAKRPTGTAPGRPRRVFPSVAGRALSLVDLQTTVATPPTMSKKMKNPKLDVMTSILRRAPRRLVD
jgi:hypothetical protein